MQSESCRNRLATRSNAVQHNTTNVVRRAAKKCNQVCPPSVPLVHDAAADQMQQLNAVALTKHGANKHTQQASHRNSPQVCT